jgi:predicted RNA-binding Zn-ribbon protein involved in translation (DUF1610 family)
VRWGPTSGIAAGGDPGPRGGAARERSNARYRRVRDAPAVDTFNTAPRGRKRVALELDHPCPTCGETRTYYRTASTRLELGRKTKWRCPECSHGFVRIDGIETTAA